MGYIAHHAIVVTGHDDSQIRAVHQMALDIGLRCSGVVTSPLNGYASFLVVPDGSKEGWTDSDIGEEKREKFLRALRDSGMFVDWILVRYGGDEPSLAVIEERSGGECLDDIAGTNPDSHSAAVAVANKPKPCCGTCRFSEGVEHADFALCRAHPPVMTDEGREWPLVRKDDWCGEHEEEEG